METLKIILFSIAAGIIYGVIHDQITARVCIEYFTVFHPKVIESNSPTLLAFAWGVIATWWAGAFLGTLLAIAARAGSRPTLKASVLIPPITTLLGVMALSALLAGCSGYLLSRGGVISPSGWLLLPAARYPFFMADLWAHSASYGSSFLGGIALFILTYRRRSHLAEKNSQCHRMRTLA